jgi:hypothetical protein
MRHAKAREIALAVAASPPGPVILLPRNIAQQANLL